MADSRDGYAGKIGHGGQQYVKAPLQKADGGSEPDPHRHGPAHDGRQEAQRQRGQQQVTP